MAKVFQPRTKPLDGGWVALATWSDPINLRDVGSYAVAETPEGISPRVLPARDAALAEAEKLCARLSGHRGAPPIPYLVFEVGPFLR